MRVKAVAAPLVLLLLALPGSPPVVSAQQPAAATAATRAAERIGALRREAEALAAAERTLLGDLRKLEVERDLRTEEALKLDADAESVARQVEEAGRQAAGIEEAIRAARPGLNARLVDVYKLGRPGYARVLLGVGSFREFGRATRLVSALAGMDQRRVQEFTASIGRLAATRAALSDRASRLERLREEAKQAVDLAAKAASARQDLVRQVDAQRDLNARMAGELEVAAERLRRTVDGLQGVSPTSELVVLPIKPFRGALEWPVTGRLLARFGDRRNPRFGTTTTRSGIEVETAAGRPVRAVHDGRVAFADVFAGLGQLVIVDHGGLAFSLYGYLGSMSVTRGAAVTDGQAIGTTGRGPAGNPAVYFELRIDGKPVDPLQWLKAR